MSLKDSYLGQAWLVLVLALCFGAALAGVELGLSGRIDANKRKETEDQFPKLVPNAVAGEKMEIAGTVVYAVKNDTDQHVGWVVKASGQGYADRIELLIGLGPMGERVTGLWVLDQKETPNLGNKIVDEEFRRPFFTGWMSTRRKIRPVKGKPDRPNRIQAVSGATISSQAVCTIVNRATKKLRDELSRLGKELLEPPESRPTTTRAAASAPAAGGT